jgi:hypothetical protein
MNTLLLPEIDTLLDNFKKENRNQAPLYIVLSPEESRALVEEIRAVKKYPKDYIITSYKDVKIAANPSLLNGKRYVSNDLPETGS